MTPIERATDASGGLSRALRSTFLVHAVVAFVVALPLFLVPETWAELVGWGATDPAMARFLGAGLLGLSGASWLGYRAATWSAVRILVFLEVLFPGLLVLAGLYELLALDAPIFAWVPVAVSAAFAVAFSYHYRAATATNTSTDAKPTA